MSVGFVPGALPGEHKCLVTIIIIGRPSIVVEGVDHPVGMLPNVPFYLPSSHRFSFHAIGQRYPVTAETFNLKFTVDEENKMEIITTVHFNFKNTEFKNRRKLYNTVENYNLFKLIFVFKNYYDRLIRIEALNNTILVDSYKSTQTAENRSTTIYKTNGEFFLLPVQIIQRPRTSWKLDLKTVPQQCKIILSEKNLKMRSCFTLKKYIFNANNIKGIVEIGLTHNRLRSNRSNRFNLFSGDMFSSVYYRFSELFRFSTFARILFSEGSSGARLAVSIKNKPIEIKDYNDFMSGIDRSDQMVSYYSCPRKTARWYKKVLFHLLDISIWNSYFIFNKKFGVTNKLLQENFSKTKKIKKAAPENNHYSEKIPPPPNFKRETYLKNCKQCYKTKIRKQTSFQCKSCGKPLCPSKCFEEWHKDNII
ncbi:hypothetical protein AGLY_000837 [Aphis glycines]|uniref:PiggyBac transposable element-derived protein domain-containing protein n=1 Tax=Aphis glycines TaxID=307491 RepID=A0A6G0U892_APHGL|nr:hypothetical protein AGLY_000837 [Aphis glycines]